MQGGCKNPNIGSGYSYARLSIRPYGLPMPITSPKEAKGSSAATLAELKKLIESYKINAISVDTTTFDDSGKDYDKGIFSQLRQFKVHPQQLIISEVVLKEIDRHYRERLTKSNMRFSLIGNVCSLLGATPESISIIESELSKLPPIDKICGVRLQEFLSESNAIVLKPDDYIKVSDITSIYFKESPPFHTENSKKSEFPDAIALVTLEKWAEANRTGVVVVSRDGDWEAFCEKSERLHIVKSLADALSIFQPPAEIVESMSLRLAAHLRNSQSFITSLVEESIEEHDWSDNIIAIAHSSYEFDQEIYCRVLSTSFIESGDDAIKITNTDGKTVSFAFKFDVNVIAILDCDFKRWVESNQEYESIGHTEWAQDFPTVVSVLLTVPVSQGEFYDVKIQIQPSTIRIDFGDIEPD